MKIDLTEISIEQAIIDRNIARARIVELSCRIDVASCELLKLREELDLLRGHDAQTSLTFNSSEEMVRLERSSQLLSKVSALPTGVIGRLSDLRRPTVIAHTDTICGKPVDGRRQVPIVRADHRYLTISGWVVPRNHRQAISEVVVSLVTSDEARRVHERTTSREDVAKHFSNQAFVKSGFQCAFPMKEITAGTYTVELSAQIASKIARRRLFSVVLK